MAKKKKCPPIPACEKWAVPLADFFSLLLALFIALYAIASVNLGKSDAAGALKEEFVKIFDFPKTQAVQKDMKKDKSKAESKNKEDDALEILKAVNQAQQEELEKLRALLDQNENNFYLNLPTAVYFDQDAHNIKNLDDEMFLKRIAMIIKQIGKMANVEIRGYSDNSQNYIKSFDISNKRASEVMYFLVKEGVNPKQITIKSFGQNNPKFSNTSDDRIRNNRVEIYFSTDINDIKTQKHILDSIENTFK